MLIVDQALLEPGGCYLTDRSEGPLIDTLLDIDDRPVHGRVYLAVSTVSDLVDIIGGLGPDGAATLRGELAEARAKIAELESAVEGLVTANQALVTAGYPVEKPTLLPHQDDPLADLTEVEALEVVEPKPKAKR